MKYSHIRKLGDIFVACNLEIMQLLLTFDVESDYSDTVSVHVLVLTPVRAPVLSADTPEW